MLSRRDKLLLQPWEDRRFKDHRSKIKSALPAIDDRTPPARPHVALKLKKCQKEIDRNNKIQSENFSLLQRLSAIMKVNRLDNHWRKPLPNFQHKVGLFYNVEDLNNKISARSILQESPEVSHSNVKCYACEIKRLLNVPLLGSGLPVEDWTIYPPRLSKADSMCRLPHDVFLHCQHMKKFDLKQATSNSRDSSLPSIYSSN